MSAPLPVRPRCAWCDTPARRVVHSASDHVFEDETRDDAEKRIANGRRVIRSRWTGVGLHSSVNGRKIRGYLALSLEPADGPRFVLRYAPFCKLTCAEEFARAAYLGGFRRSKP